MQPLSLGHHGRPKTMHQLLLTLTTTRRPIAIFSLTLLLSTAIFFITGFFPAQKPIFLLLLLLPLPLLKPWLLLVALYYGFMDWVTRALPMYSSRLSLLVLNFVPPNGLSLLLPFPLSPAM